MELLVMQLALFVLSLFLGVELITKVPPTLHTPLMSGTNAISGITLVSLNVVGGYLVTNRMLAMFKRKN